MTDAATIQARIDRGSGIAAAKLGETCDWRRPTSALAGPAVGTSRGTVLAWFNPDYAYHLLAPGTYGKPLFGALCNRTGMLAGDYLFAPSGTFFVAAVQPLLATGVVSCNAVLSIARPQGNSAPGVQPYGGATVETDEPLMTGWPASVLTSGRTQASKMDLPNAIPQKGDQALLPAWPGLILRTGDRVRDDQGRAWGISAAEETDLGWRLELVLTVA